MRERTTAILLIAVVALGAMTGVAAAEGHLEVSVDDTGDAPVVSVTENGTAVANASVNVSVVDEANESYAGAGDYTTDENGTVALPAVEEDVTVNVTATSDNETASAENVLLEAPGTLELDVSNTSGEPVVTVTDNGTAVANASVNVTTADGQNVTYVGEGGYETDENGTVTLDAAENNVTVDVTAEYENETVSTTADLTTGGEDAEAQPFGQLVRDFIKQISDREGGIGAAVSEFVTENNPGNAPDHAGNGNNAKNGSNAGGNGNAPDHAGNSSDKGKPDDVGTNGDKGKPDDAGNGNNGGGNNGGGNNGGGNSGGGNNGGGNNGGGPGN
ncbi:hypothetical protein [Halorubrum sp. HHNYT27]|uniref:hypothetical protein n=1 Tax=Halorubrum sp. HHNYT27 TaxID=3402275 RepID=UPI003EC0F29D